MPVQDDLDIVSWIMQPGQILDRAQRVMDRRQLRSDDHGQPVRLTNSGARVFAQAGRAIDDDKFVIVSQKRQGMLDGIGWRIAKRLHGLRCIQYMESAVMLQQETLQQLGVQPVHVMNQLIEAVLMAPQAETESNFSQRRMMIDQQNVLVMPLDQTEGQMYSERGYTRPAFGSNQTNDSAFLAGRLPLPPRLNMRESLQHPVGLERLHQILRTPSAHCGNDLLGTGVARGGEQGDRGPASCP